MLPSASFNLRLSSFVLKNCTISSNDSITTRSILDFLFSDLPHSRDAIVQTHNSFGETQSQRTMTQLLRARIYTRAVA